MNKHFVIAALSLLATLSLWALGNHLVGNNQQSSQTRHYMKIEMGKSSTDNSDNVLRVSCALIGVPHTSSRVDSIIGLIGGKQYRACDIDGIDFNRYFQWEDDAVEIEIDFPVKKLPGKNDSIYIYTVHGQYKSPFKRN